MKNKFYTRFDLPESSPTPVGEVSLTNQESFAESNIYSILNRWLRGERPAVTTQHPIYADLSQDMDFVDSYNFISNAIDNFETLPFEVRSKFENDPFVFFEKCSKDPSILTKAVEEYNNVDNSGSASEISSNNSISETEDIIQ